MTKCVAHFQTEEIQRTKNIADNCRVVRLYDTCHHIANAGFIGKTVPDKVERLGAPTSTAAYDFLTISMAVTAADTFFRREDVSQNGWARDFELHVPLVQPAKWAAVEPLLRKILNFLTGDSWAFTFLPNGPSKPNAVGGRLRKKSNLTNVDSVCLYSGGLDSWLGAKHLTAGGKNPILVSHSYPQDARRQNYLYDRLGYPLQRFSLNASPRQSGSANDTTMRGRSFNFLAMGAVCADAVAELNGLNQVPLYIPENGFIALNAPLTPRRVGSHSTRTAHPNYLSQLQELFSRVGIRANIGNPFWTLTKGEMMKNAALTADDQRHACQTVSCGKWKRKSEQCGRCLPCLIRRASFHKAGIVDSTPYTYSIPQNFAERDGTKKDDLMAVIRSVRQTTKKQRLVNALKSGPLPIDSTERRAWLSVYERGLEEMGDFLTSQGV
ncbi:7-cyano-7-deazaguanine synthase (queuosine biosynthesis) [Epibacterium ulvae]|uniref:7-cyano-7-deazaguanine synthase (Queuosine biosynthesis) n=2 Tax=Epibacterium ulvae TaxID=1156985 RepID=A0A1G5RIN8_9RHOB|nr:Qat anti-phage system QueC-like protein QatC [Epibacterium ulvae]SCZ73907.1 7-cyano-7-deazaguanine synthase (queuosine biosynthesis) [Epibacterium ulvae]